MDKTTVMKMLDKKGIKYNAYTYGNGEAMSGVDVAKLLGQDENQVFKTLVTTSKSGKNYVFVIPSTCELDLKKAAKRGTVPFEEVLRTITSTPAAIYGLKNSAGTIVENGTANFAVLNEDLELAETILNGKTLWLKGLVR